MSADNQNVEVRAGNSLIINILLKSKSGDPVVLAGATINWWVSRLVTSTGADILIQKSSSPEIITSGSTISVVLLPADTEHLAPGNYYHETQVNFADGRVSTVSSGILRVSKKLIALG